jgi:predicted transcriptional regulator
MPSTTIRVSLETRQALQALSEAQGKSLQEITEEAIETYRRQTILHAANQAYAALQTDAGAQRRWSEELSDWDVTLSDGLDTE